MVVRKLTMPKLIIKPFIFGFYFFTICFVHSNKASEIARPRGVSISKASLYVGKEFRCFDGSNLIPINQVNDDYCDCTDGSDEPGTAACPNSFFHCTNAGFRPLNIPSAQVNDGICDCCDGGDEYAGKRFCENTCQVLGKAERQEQYKRAEIAKIGNQARLEASKKGKALKEEKKEKLDMLKRDQEEADKIRLAKEAIKNDAEELEKSALEAYKSQEEENAPVDSVSDNETDPDALAFFKLIDSNKDDKVSVSELQVRQTFDQNRDGAVSDEEASFFLDGNEELSFPAFLYSSWPRIKPLVIRDKAMFTPPQKGEGDLGVGTVEDVTGEYQQEQRDSRQDEDGEELDQGDVENDGEEEEEEEDEEEEEEGTVEETPEAPPSPQVPHTPEYDPHTQILVDAAQSARSELEEADRNVRDIQREMTQLSEYLEKDFGPEEEFAPLEGECYEYTDREYIYKLCPFDQASQRPRNGGSETRLGVWKQWAGPAENKYSAMLFDKGQSCWNGPQRSTFVSVSCGVENALIGVSEPNKCEYHFQLTSPSACRVGDGLPDPPHDEL